MAKNNVVEQYSKYVMATYTKTPLVIVKGKGKYVWDDKGKKYLDFFPGWAVSGLGHCHPRVVKGIKEQVEKIIHVSNNYYNVLQGELAEEIIKNSFPGKVFFCNSGAEAVESAIKLARKYGGPKRYEIIGMDNSFHGRTLAAITLTGQKKYQKGFEPLPAGFKHVPFNDYAALEKAITKKTAAIVIEPIQGEGGINVAGKAYLKKVRKLCDKEDILLIFDEIQTGLGRTGKMFCYQHYGITPDAMTLAKTLGGGLPIGALVADSKVSEVLTPGTHASTFGGSPVVCAGSLAVFEAIKKDKLLKNVNSVSKYLFKKIGQLKVKYPDIIKGVKGKGLMIGVVLKCPGAEIASQAFKKGLLINCTQTNIIRLLPPLTINKKDVDKAVNILDKLLRTR
ncbi:MAG: acetylornithine transaminase [Candidatus Omnitrophica bacterium]|nr:acetylornithine transaminase [Candidatus Omnitrophota bacterium]